MYSAYTPAYRHITHISNQHRHKTQIPSWNDTWTWGFLKKKHLSKIDIKGEINSLSQEMKHSTTGITQCL